MSREFKFRMWDKEHALFFYISLTIDKHRVVIGSPPNIGNPSLIGEIMQYTGLKDKNGVDIYEGDIIREDGTNSVVEWSEDICGEYGCIGWTGLGRGYPAEIPATGEGLEVIGNIMENPHLLTPPREDS